MNDNFLEQLQQKFPLMYANTYDLWIDDGWHQLVMTLSDVIQRYIDSANSRRQWLIDQKFDDNIPEPVEQVVVAQVKEKFGELRFYYDGGDEYIAGLVAMAEEMSIATCERCGNPGRLRDGGWVKTLCDAHHEEREGKHGSVEIP